MDEVGGNPGEKVICGNDNCRAVQSPNANGIICEKCGSRNLRTEKRQEVYVPRRNWGSSLGNTLRSPSPR